MREELWLPAENGDATRAPFFILPYAEQSRACPRYANFIRADGEREIERERGKRRGSKKHLLELGNGMNCWSADFIKIKCFRRQMPKIEVIGRIIPFLGNTQHRQIVCTIF